MESNRRRRRRRRDKKPKKTLESSSSSVHDVPDHLLEVILLRVDSYVSLIRAAWTCKRWRRIVADGEFLRRLHPQPSAPLILGHHDERKLVFVPSSTPSILRESLSLDFVPKFGGGAWEIADSRDTLLLLSKKDWTTRSSSGNPSYLVVCRPATRRYELISVRGPDRLAGRQCLGLFLVDGGGGSGRSIGLSNFKVIAVLLRDRMLVPGRGVPVACVYEEKWGWRDVSCSWNGGDISIPDTAGSFCFAGRANGCLYWAINGAGAALVLDEVTTGVSLVVHPGAGYNWFWYASRRRFRFLGGQEGGGGAVALRAVQLMYNDLRVYARLGVGDEWVLQNLVPLPVVETATRDAVIVAAHETYVIVRPRDSARLLSVDLKTMAVEYVRQGIMDCGGAAYPYELPWPPTLDLEAAAADNSDTNTEEYTGGFLEIPYSLLKATQNISFSLLGVLVSFCSNKILGR